MNKIKVLKKENKKLYEMAKKTFPSYNKYGKVYLEYTDYVTIKNTTWVSGTKSVYRMIDIETGNFKQSYINDDITIKIPEGCAIIKMNTISGIDMDLTILMPLVVKF
jgi:hypothetical protein